MFPFSTLRTYIARSVPVIEAVVLNTWQLFFVDLAYRVVRQRVSAYLHSYNGTDLKLEYLRGTFVVDSVTGQWVAVEVPEPTTTLTVSDLVPAAMTFATDTWYYVYVRAASRVPSFVISATAPATGRFFGADETYRYVGCFRTGSGSEILPFNERDGIFYFTGGRPGDTVFSPIITSTSWTNLGTTFLPPGIRRGTVRAYVSNTNTSDSETLSLLPNGVSGTIVSPGTYGRQLLCPRCPTMGGLAEVDDRLVVEFADGPNQLQAKVLNGGGASGAVVAVESFEDFA